ncbi:unnamed protein product [Leptosia nina]|uniref:Methylenetetrahydrofolate reductase (NAD(P)H) n=1 Tax=Leptosia nina TaxID=320188 RepID=A0AAV1J1V0_9NEOP
MYLCFLILLRENERAILNIIKQILADIDMGHKITELLSNAEKFSYSFEVTPDITEDKLNNISLEPAFYSITWHAKLYEFKDLNIPPLRLAESLANKNKNVLLNLSCHKLRKPYLNGVLDYLKSNNVCNLFAIQGEGYDENLSDFKSTSELVTYIREHSGDFFSIGVAGHCEKLASVEALKSKMDSGADFIMTQAFFDPNVFKSFVDKCKDADITAPIIPGVFPFENQAEVERFITLCKIHVDPNVMETIKNQSTVHIVKNLIDFILKETDVRHFHFFTMNKFERASNIIEEVIKSEGIR